MNHTQIDSGILPTKVGKNKLLKLLIKKSGEILTVSIPLIPKKIPNL